MYLKPQFISIDISENIVQDRLYILMYTPTCAFLCTAPCVKQLEQDRVYLKNDMCYLSVQMMGTFICRIPRVHLYLSVQMMRTFICTILRVHLYLSVQMMRTFICTKPRVHLYLSVQMMRTFICTIPRVHLYICLYR